MYIKSLIYYFEKYIAYSSRGSKWVSQVRLSLDSDYYEFKFFQDRIFLDSSSFEFGIFRN